MLKTVTKIAKTILRFIIDIVEAFITALAIFIFVYLFLFQPHQVRGNSMLPNFHDKEYLLTNKAVYYFKQPQRGDVIIFESPQNKNFDYIKRIIGLPGETVSLENGKININSQALDETPYLPENGATPGGSFLGTGDQITVPQNQYFVIGDNRTNSSDSRDWGPIPKENIVGRAWLRYWPPQKFGFLPTID